MKHLKFIREQTEKKGGIHERKKKAQGALRLFGPIVQVRRNCF